MFQTFVIFYKNQVNGVKNAKKKNARITQFPQKLNN